MKKVKERCGLKKFFNCLRENGFKLTGQRKQILSAFIKTERHLSAEEVYELVKVKGIGYATVYRTLKLLESIGVARGVNFGVRRRLYEHKYRHKHHDHLVCIRCGKSVEIFDKELEQIQDRLSEKKGFTPAYHELNIFGVCKRCGLKL